MWLKLSHPTLKLLNTNSYSEVVKTWVIDSCLNGGIEWTGQAFRNKGYTFNTHWNRWLLCLNTAFLYRDVFFSILILYLFFNTIYKAWLIVRTRHDIVGFADLMGEEIIITVIHKTKEKWLSFCRKSLIKMLLLIWNSIFYRFRLWANILSKVKRKGAFAEYDDQNNVTV